MVDTANTLPADDLLHDVTASEHCEIQRFLFREAQLLDERRLDEWLDLLDEELDYVVVGPTWPSATGAPDRRPANEFLDQTHLPFTVLTKATVALRVRRLLSGRALDDDPPVPTVRMITNVDAVRAASAEIYSVRSAFSLCRELEDRQHMLTGTRRDTLVKGGGALRIARRIVEVNARSYPSNLILV